MKIAVTYDNGEVFQHFGRTENFKVYEIEDNKVISSEVISSNGVGHGALAGVLADRNVKALICGGIGGGAINALTEAGIEVCSGASGDTDKAVEDYLNGKLIDAGQTCDHHGEGHTCGDHEEGHSCGSSCGGGCGGCGGSQPPLTGRNVGKTCRTHYRGTFNDGTQFDSSYDRGEPLEFVCGAGQMIKGFDAAVVDMQVGEKKTVHIPAADAYGEHNPEMVITFPAEQVPNIEQIEKGMKLFLSTPSGMPVPAVVIDVTPEAVTLDANHELAGKDLNFDIELVEVEG